MGEWPVVRLLESEAEDLFAAGDVGLIPWIPLTKSNLPPEELLRRCRDRIAEVKDVTDRKGLLAITQILARVTFPDPRFANFFGGVETMIESPALDEFKEVVSQRAAAESLREALLDNLELRFGSVPAALAETLAEVKDAGRLRELHRLSVTCPTLEAFLAGLQSE